MIITTSPNPSVEATADGAVDLPLEFLISVSHGPAVAHARRSAAPRTLSMKLRILKYAAFTALLLMAVTCRAQWETHYWAVSTPFGVYGLVEMQSDHIVGNRPPTRWTRVCIGPLQFSLRMHALDVAVFGSLLTAVGAFIAHGVVRRVIKRRYDHAAEPDRSERGRATPVADS